MGLWTLTKKTGKGYLWCLAGGSHCRPQAFATPLVTGGGAAEQARAGRSALVAAIRAQTFPCPAGWSRGGRGLSSALACGGRGAACKPRQHSVSAGGLRREAVH